MNPTPSDQIPSRVVAREFVLVNDAGETVASMGVDEAQQPVIALFAPGGAPRLSLQLVDGLPTVLLRDSTEVERAALTIGSSGEVGLTMRDQAGKDRIVLGTGDEGEAAVQVLGPEGEVRVEMATELDGETTLFLYAANAEPRIAMVVKDADSNVFSLDDPDGGNAILMAATSDGSRKLLIIDKDDHARIFAGVEAGQDPEIGLIDEE